MYHLLILVFGLDSDSWNDIGDIVASDKLIAATNDEHVIFRVLQINCIDNGVFVAGYFDIFFDNFMVVFDGFLPLDYLIFFFDFDCGLNFELLLG